MDVSLHANGAREWGGRVRTQVRGCACETSGAGESLLLVECWPGEAWQTSIGMVVLLKIMEGRRGRQAMTLLGAGV